MESEKVMTFLDSIPKKTRFFRNLHSQTMLGLSSGIYLLNPGNGMLLKFRVEWIKIVDVCNVLTDVCVYIDE